VPWPVGAGRGAKVCLGNQVLLRSVAESVPPGPSSFRAELTGILLALEEPEESVDAAILTDSLLSIQWMIAAQRLDWPIWLRSIMASQHSLLSIQWMIAAQRLDWSPRLRSNTAALQSDSIFMLSWTS
jgi:ribonuclease HI